MSSLIQWPFKRKTYSGVNNPRFVSDIQAANEAVYDAITAITGLNNTDFAIISGLDFVAGSPNNTFTSGIFYLNGVIYVMAAAFNENFYLAPNPTDIMSTPFDGGIGSRFIYTVNYAQTSSTAPGNTPKFTGNMNQYRIGLKYFRASIISLLATQAGLGTASHANLGTGAGQVLTANQTYTQAQVNALMLTRGPSVIGSIVHVYDPSGAFAANFNGTGIGIVYPWKNGTEVWALMDGQGGRPNMGGVTIVGIGTFTNPDASTKVFANNDTGGETQHTLVLAEVCDPKVRLATSTTGAPGGNGLGYNEVKTNDDILLSSAGIDPTLTGGTGVAGPHNVMNPYIAMFVVVRIS